LSQDVAGCIGKFGQQIAGCVEALNDVCIKFFKYINHQVFRNESEWRQALLEFKNSVTAHATGTRHDKQLLYSQIEELLLKPSKFVTGKVVTGSGQMEQNMQVLLTTAGDGTKCSVCGKTEKGVFVRCSTQRCTAVMHCYCASANAPSKKYGTTYYSCPSHSSVIEMSGREDRKRRSKGAGKGREKKPKKADKTEPVIGNGNGSIAHPAVTDAAGSGICAAEGNRAAAASSNSSSDTSDGSSSDTSSCDQGGHNGGDFPTDGSARTAASDVENTVNSLRGGGSSSSFSRSLSSGIDGDDSDQYRRYVRYDVCAEVVFLKNDTESLKQALQTTHAAVHSNVSDANAVRIRNVLGEIRSAVGTLTRLVHESGMHSSMTSQFPVGGGAAVSSDVLGDADGEITSMQNYLSALQEFFESADHQVLPPASVSSIPYCNEQGGAAAV
jgi:hypothetical protein